MSTSSRQSLHHPLVHLDKAWPFPLTAMLNTHPSRSYACTCVGALCPMCNNDLPGSSTGFCANCGKVCSLPTRLMLSTRTPCPRRGDGLGRLARRCKRTVGIMLDRCVVRPVSRLSIGGIDKTGFVTQSYDCCRFVNQNGSDHFSHR